MGLASGGLWNSSYRGAEIDGVDMWDAITTNGESPRSEIVHYYDGTTISLQMGDVKFIGSGYGQETHDPTYVFEEDQNPDSSVTSCENPSLMTLSLASIAKDTVDEESKGDTENGPTARAKEFFRKIRSVQHIRLYLISAAVGLIAVLTAYALVVGGTRVFAGVQDKMLFVDTNETRPTGDEYEPLTGAVADPTEVNGGALVVEAIPHFSSGEEDEAKDEENARGVLASTSAEGVDRQSSTYGSF
jgi:hypothetical protein